MIFILLTTIQTLLVLCLSQSEDFQMIVHFTLNVTDQENYSKSPVEYDLKRNQNLLIQPNTNLSFYCSASGTLAAYVMLAVKDRYNVTMTNNNTNELILQHDITNANCHDSATFTCIAGNSNRTLKVNVTGDIIIKCPVDEIRFEEANQYAAVSKNKVNITLICEEIDLQYSMTLLNGRNISHYLNFTEHGHRITYYFPIIKCDDMGNYICVINRSKSPDQKKEKLLSISVNNCPPRMCSDWENYTVIYNNADSRSVIFCVEVALNVTVIAVYYNGRWLESKHCNNETCLEYSQDKSETFGRKLNLTFKEENPSDVEDKLIKIGSGYNFRNNYINITIKMNRTRRINYPNESMTTSKTTRYQDRRGSKVADQSDDLVKTIFIVIVGILCFVTVVTGVIAYRYKRKFHNDRSRRIRSRPHSRFKYLARCFQDGSAYSDEDVYCNTKKTMKAVKRKSVVQKVDLGDGPSELFKKAQPNLYQKFRARVRTQTSQTRSIESDNADSGEDSGRYLSDDGLIYVTLGSVNKKRRHRVCQRKRRRRRVKYAKLDYTKSGKLVVADDNCLYEDGDHVYQNVPAVPHVYQNVPVVPHAYPNVPAGQDIYQNVPAYV